MSYNFIHNAENATVTQECVHDTNVGYEADFTVNGEVDGWVQYPGIHTYGCWNGFLFGTFYGSSAYIGRQNTFTPVPAETHFVIKIAMKLNSTTATTGRIKWRTVSNPTWTDDKTLDFTVNGDNQWHTYILEMDEEQWWQGDINNLRFYPMIDGEADDEFFIRALKISSVSTYDCNSPTCSFYNSYEHPCQGIGKRGYCLAKGLEENYFTIEEGVNDQLIVNINEYGNEIIEIPAMVSGAGNYIAKEMTKEISKVDVGGYAECEVTYSEEGKFKIYSGTWTDDSQVAVTGGSAATTLGFDETTTDVGETPASNFSPKSSFKVKTFQVLSLFDNNENSVLEFNPFMYNIEGGRRDVTENGLGTANVVISSEDSEITTRDYEVLDNEGKTIIDFDHPFNASGRIKKVYCFCTIDDADGNERTDCKIKVLRPRRDGTMIVVDSLDIPPRQGGGKLYSWIQEVTEIDCDIWVNKGDLLGVYNALLYVGKSKFEGQTDASYYQVTGDVTGEFDPGSLNGDGNAGLGIYARSDVFQKKVVIDIDLGNRVNIRDIVINGSTESINLEYNVARCLDINWTIDLFGGTHDTGYWDIWNSEWDNFNHANVAYGIDKLTDGIYTVPEGLAAAGYSASNSTGVVPSNPNYFWVNGDAEWLGTHFHIPGQYQSNPYVKNFDHDPIQFTLLFPNLRKKNIYKSRIYFKERYNARNFYLAYYLGPDDTTGTTDSPNWSYIPEYSAVTLDTLKYHEDMDLYDQVDDYLFENPSAGGEPVYEGPIVVNGTQEVTNFDAYVQAVALDWNVLTHEWEPINCAGFRFYTDFHKSTKITEMELYCSVGDIGSSMAGSITTIYSQYEDIWSTADLTETSTSVTAYIGDTPRYFQLEIEPISTIRLTDILFTVTEQDVYVGPKGCDYTIQMDHAKTGVENQPQQVEFKNVYGDNYSLEVDIPANSEYDQGLIFFNKMNSPDEVNNPTVGPGCIYKKKEHYPLVNQNHNCAINCDCWGLRNIVDGKSSYYSVEGDSWDFFSTVYSGTSVDAHNNKIIRRTVAYLPTMFRTRYWKIGFTCQDQTMNMREAKIFGSSGEFDATCYHDPGVVWEDPVSELAPHLNNGSLTGSYYVMEDESYITFDVGGQEIVDHVTFFNDNVTSDYSNTGCGIDRYTKLCLHCDDIDGPTNIYDSSYFPKTVHARGNAVLTNSPGAKFGNTSVQFDGLPTTYLEVEADDDWDFYHYRWTIDFWVKFNSYPQEQTDWLYTVSGTGPADRTGIENCTDHDRNSYFNKTWSTISFVWGTTRPVNAIYLKYYWPTGNTYRDYMDSSGNWVNFSSGGGSGGLTDEWSKLNGTYNIKGIRVRNSASGPSEFYDIRAIQIDNSKDMVLASNWVGQHPAPGWDRYGGTSGMSWIFLWRDYGGGFRSLEHYVRGWRPSWGWIVFKRITYRSPSLTSWQHLAFIYGPQNYTHDTGAIYVNGSRKVLGEDQIDYIQDTNNPLIFGQGFDGLMDEIRISCGDVYNPDYNDTTYGGSRYGNSFTPFTHAYEKFYGMTVYTSDDNITYSKFADLELKYDIDDDAYYYATNKWSQNFYSYWAIDLGKRYALQIVRNYAGSNLLVFNQDSSVVTYSSDNTSDVSSVTFNDDYDDARWIRVALYSGDSTDRYVRKLGVYPSLTNYLAPGGAYNHLWDELGSAVTMYGSGINIALLATVSGSSEFGTMQVGRVTDGVLGTTLTECWGSDSSATQWVEIELDTAQIIYRVKVFHGYDDEDLNYLIEDYTIDISEDGLSYTTVVDVTGNSDLERIHDFTPASAKFIKMNITSYVNDPIYLATEDSYDWFEGAVLREIQVFENYGEQIISSEEYPVICMNMKDQFFVTGYSLVGINAEDTSTDWSNADSNFAYSDSVLTEPKKISFGEWGGSPDLEQWVAIKRNTATNLSNGPDYLKNAKITSVTQHNPCEYSWWWRSNLSTLSNDYDHVKDTVRSLQIDYPASVLPDEIAYIEGDNFGVDSDAGWRDGISLWWYMDDVTKLDRSYGYFYLSGSVDEHPVEYQWDISTMSGSLANGWNYFYLRPRLASTTEYVPYEDEAEEDVRIVSNLTLEQIGLKFRGVGEAFTMYLDGFQIERNQFYDYSKFDYGLYLSKEDMVTCPLGEFDLSKGTIEFWMRPDYNNVGSDIFNRFRYRTLFHFSNVVNDIFGAMVGQDGLSVYYGNVSDGVNIMNTYIPFLGLDVLNHIAIVFSNDGTAIGSDRSTIRLYVSGLLASKITDTWEVRDNKFFKFTIGGQAFAAVKEAFESSAVDAVLSNFKIYNYCKTDFSESLQSGEELSAKKIIKPNDFLEISSDNLTYYSIGDPNLPLRFESVPPDETRIVYARAVIPDGLTGTEIRTGSIIANWEISV